MARRNAAKGRYADAKHSAPRVEDDVKLVRARCASRVVDNHRMMAFRTPDFLEASGNNVKFHASYMICLCNQKLYNLW